jgi:hypothetical protein
MNGPSFEGTWVAEARPCVPVSAEEVARLRRRTGMPWMECKRFLASLTPSERDKYIVPAEAQPDGPLHDPIEDDPAIRPLFLTICEEATREAEEWRRQRIAELERQSPAVADLFRRGQGLCHRIWARTKALLRERHGIEWRSPAEMNPGVIFD